MKLSDLQRFSFVIYDSGLIFKELRAKIKYRHYIKKLKRNVELKNYKSSDKVYVCGNGPSLKKVNFDELDGDTIVLNDFWRMAEKFKTPPTYYIVNDEAYALDVFKERMLGVLNCCPTNPHVFAINMGPSIDKNYSDYSTNIFYYNPIGRTFKSYYGIDFTKCTHYVWNVVSSAIQLAIYLGYKEIFLLGCDYSLFASHHLQHCYDKEGEKRSHISTNMRDVLYKYSFTTHLHYQIAEYARIHGIKIINMTSASLLDAYEIDLNSRY